MQSHDTSQHKYLKQRIYVCICTFVYVYNLLVWIVTLAIRLVIGCKHHKTLLILNYAE
jgi:hypothetical protein